MARCFVKVAGTIVLSVCGPSSSNRKWNSPTRNIVCVLLHMAKHNLQVVHLFQILCREKKSSITSNILYAARRDCRANPRVWPPPYLEKRMCVNNTSNSTVRLACNCGSSCARLSTKRCGPKYQSTVFWSETIGTALGPPGRERMGMGRENVVENLFLIMRAAVPRRRRENRGKQRRCERGSISDAA